MSTASQTSSPRPSTLCEAEKIIEQLQQKLQFSELRVLVLEERLRKRRIEKYGAGSEKLSNLQLEMLEQEPGVSQAEVQAESERPVIAGDAVEVAGYQRQRRSHPGRQSLPAELPRVEKVIACPAEHCVCGQCGQPTTVIGYEESEQLEVEPAKYFVLVTKREKRGCRFCPGARMVTAPAPARIIDKGLVSDRVVIDTVIRKYCDHLPLYRQNVILNREAGVDISRATLDGWVMQVGEMLRPLVAVMGRELVQGGYLQADETPVPVQMRDGRRGKNHNAFLWQYGRPGRETVFEFRLGRDRAGPKEFLKNFHGILQTDAYQAYDKVGGAGMVHAGCWSHARRGFANVVKLNPGDPVATSIVAKINALFAVDAEAREQGLSVEARHQLRQQKAPTLLEKIKAAIEAAKPGALPGGALENACEYAIGNWPRLICFLEHPELELSNNLAENSMRPVVLGRKNWIHIGSPQAGPKVAAILSVIETCRRLKVSARDYLSTVLPGLAETRVQCLPDLTPTAWAAQRQ